jgi:hypothetical protein
MSLASLKNLVILYTNRPDLDSLTESAVKATARKFHSSGYFPQDVTVETITFGTVGSYQTIPYKTRYPLFRQVAYIKRLPVTGPAIPHHYSPPEQFFGSTSQLNSFTVDNTNISINSVDASTQILVGVYTYPDPGLADGVSFICDEMPDLIATEAAAIIFRATNQKEKADAFSQVAREQLNFLKQTKSASIAVK